MLTTVIRYIIGNQLVIDIDVKASDVPDIMDGFSVNIEIDVIDINDSIPLRIKGNIRVGRVGCTGIITGTRTVRFRIPSGKGIAGSGGLLIAESQRRIVNLGLVTGRACAAIGIVGYFRLP